MGTLLRLLQELSARRSHAGAGTWPLPILCLIRAPGSPPWLRGLRNRLRQTPAARSAFRRETAVIPHAYVRCDDTTAARPQGQPPRLPVLHALYNELRRSDFGVGAMRFRHYQLADWLTRQRIHDDPVPADQVLDGLLRTWLRRDRGLANPILEGTSGLARLLVGLLLVLGPGGRFRLWASGRVPGFGQPRWFLAQRRHLPDLNAHDFLNFAEQLTADRDRVADQEDQVDRLLVGAFLHDLRLAYRRRPWRIRPWRRTAHVIALLEDISVDNGGARLIRLIGKVRADTAETDPLLVVADFPGERATTLNEGWSADPGSAPAGDTVRIALAPLPAAGVDDAYDGWLATAAHARGQAAGWWLPLWVPAPGPPPPRPADLAGPATAGATGWRRPLTPPPWPLGARRRVLWPAALVVLLLTGVVAWVTTTDIRHGCWSQAKDVSVSWLGGECVGYSAGPFTFGDTQSDSSSVGQLVAVQKAIFEQNTCADELRHERQSRKFVTLVYFAALSEPRSTRVNWAAAQVAELEGLLTWQRYENVVPGSKNPACRPDGSTAAPQQQGGPIVRVVVANGGSLMRFADRVTHDQLVSFATDPSEQVLGVIGLDRSVAPVERAITELGKHGVPTVATTLSGDGLTNLSPYYLQTVPQNQRQALLVADYALATQRGEVDVYFPKASCGASPDALPSADDRYVYTLVRDVRDEVTRIAAAGGHPLKVVLRGWDPPGCGSADLPTWFQSECVSKNATHLIFYAGRHADFGEFASGMSQCLDTPDGPSPTGARVVGDDAVERYVIENAGENMDHVIFRYVSKAPAVVLAGDSCADGTLADKAKNLPFPLRPELQEFCTRLHGMFAHLENTHADLNPPQIQWTDGRVALAYDAAKLFIDAVAATHQTDADTVLNWIRRAPRHGATGELDFRVGQGAESKQLAILRIDLGELAFAPASAPPPGVPLDDDPQVACKYVISGSTPATTDCMGHPLPLPLPPSSAAHA